MSIVLLGSTSGSCTLQEQAVAGSTTLTLPTFNGTVSLLVSGTAVASTSGTSIDFTSIPAGVRRITVMFNAVSLSGSANILVQGGVGGVIDSTGYASACTATSGGAGGIAASTAGYIVRLSAAGASCSGHMVLTLVGSNTWVSSFSGTFDSSTFCLVGGGTNTFSGTIDTVRITTTGADTFDAGSINILYE